MAKTTSNRSGPHRPDISGRLKSTMAMSHGKSMEYTATMPLPNNDSPIANPASHAHRHLCGLAKYWLSNSILIM